MMTEERTGYVPRATDAAQLQAARTILAALAANVLAMEATVLRLCRYAAVDSIDLPQWFRAEHASLLVAIDGARAAIAVAERAGIKAEG